MWMKGVLYYSAVHILCQIAFDIFEKRDTEPFYHQYSLVQILWRKGINEKTTPTPYSWYSIRATQGVIFHDRSQSWVISMVIYTTQCQVSIYTVITSWFHCLRLAVSDESGKIKSQCDKINSVQKIWDVMEWKLNERITDTLAKFDT